MPNTLAYFVLLAYPIVAIVLFRRCSLPVALIWTILAGYLFIPERTFLDLPLIPALDKVSIPGIAAAVMCYVASRRKALFDRNVAGRSKRAPARPAKTTNQDSNLETNPESTLQASPLQASQRAQRHRADLPPRVSKKVPRRAGKLFNICAVVTVFVPFLLYFNNSTPFFVGSRLVRGFSLYDASSFAMASAIMLIPFFLARKYLGAPGAHQALLRALLVGGLTYSLLMLIEVRLSPQLNVWLYGFFPHSFVQHVRDGYRPIVFLEHGLRVGIFICMCFLSSVALWRVSTLQKTGKYLLFAGWLFIILIFSRNLGATLIALLFLPAVAFFGVRGQLLFAAILGGVVLFYPMLRGSGLIPITTISQVATSIDNNRGASLAFRLENEDAVLNRAQQKPLFGWGGMGRWMVYDQETGQRLTVSDGAWIITIGQNGWVGYLARFGLLALPLSLLAYRRRELGLDRATSGLALILAANLVDMIPNSAMVPITWLIAGALVGRYEYRGISTEDAQVAPQRQDQRPARTDPDRDNPRLKGSPSRKPPLPARSGAAMPSSLPLRRPT